MLAPELSRALAPYRRHAVMAWLLRGLAVVLPSLGVGCLLAGWAPQLGVGIAALMLAGTLAGVAVTAAGIWRRARRPMKLAAQVERLLPELGDGVRAAVGLAQDGGHLGMSVPLTRAFVRDVANP